jgi:hypothetical protein
MTKVTMQAFPLLPRAAWRGTITGPPGSDQLWDAITAYHVAWAKHLAPVGCTGYTTGNPYGNGNLSVTVNFPGAKAASDLEALMTLVVRDTLAAVNASNGIAMRGTASWRSAATIKANAARAAAAPKPTAMPRNGGFPGSGRNKLITSWLYGDRELTHPSLKRALMGSVDADALLYQDFTGGPGVHNPPFLRGGGNAVNPGWRTAIVRAAAELQWSGTDRDKLARRKRDLLGMGSSLRLLGPRMGTYCNEADADMPHVHRAFWGTNYPRLLRIKREMDPAGVFYCKACVGSELWVETEGGGLCRK